MRARLPGELRPPGLAAAPSCCPSGECRPTQSRTASSQARLRRRPSPLSRQGWPAMLGPLRPVVPPRDMETQGGACISWGLGKHALRYRRWRAALSV